MDIQDDFSKQLYEAADAKLNWFNKQELPAVLDRYRSIHTVIKSLSSMLEKKGLIIPDPYRFDAHISDVKTPTNEHMNDGDRAQLMGVRICEFERTLDFICNAVKFSVEQLSMDVIKKLADFNTFINWNTLVPTSPKENTRRMAEMIVVIKRGSDPLATGMVTECVSQLSKDTAAINASLKELTNFKKQLYKIDIRKKIFPQSDYTVRQDGGSMTEAALQIKKLFPKYLHGVPFYTELVDQLVQEVYGPQSQQMHQLLMVEFRIPEVKKETKTKKIDTKEILLDSMRILGGLSPQYEQVLNKLVDNDAVLEEGNRSFWGTLKAAFRKAFGIPEKPKEYELTIVDPLTKATRKENVVFQNIITEIGKKSRIYAALSIKDSPQYAKMQSQTEDVIFDFVIKQQSECQRLSTLLLAFDDYFKSHCKQEDKSRIKGLRIELDTIKNSLVKSNQRRADYSSVIEEEKQMARLGINAHD